MAGSGAAWPGRGSGAAGSKVIGTATQLGMNVVNGPQTEPEDGLRRFAAGQAAELVGVASAVSCAPGSSTICRVSSKRSGLIGFSTTASMPLAR